MAYNLNTISNVKPCHCEIKEPSLFDVRDKKHLTKVLHLIYSISDFVLLEFLKDVSQEDQTLPVILEHIFIDSNKSHSWTVTHQRGGSTAICVLILAVEILISCNSLSYVIALCDLVIMI